MRNLLLTQLCLTLLTSFVCAFECPIKTQYPYGGCSCFSVSTQMLGFDAAAQYCQDNSGALLTIADTTELELLSRYLGGLVEKRQLWVGYRYNSDGVVFNSELTEMAPAVILNNMNSTIGTDEICVAVQQSSLVNNHCAQELPFLCVYTYGVPEVSLSPSERLVYVESLRTNFTLSATIATPEASITTARWRFNGVIIPSDSTSYIMTTQSGARSNQRGFSLTIPTFSPDSHTGRYELLVTGASGTTVSGTWQILETVLGDITIQPQDLTIRHGEMAGFECHAGNALPGHMVTWYKDSIRLDVSGSDRHYVSNTSGTLFIRELMFDDVGLYHCVCANGAGSVTSRQASLNVTNSFQVQNSYIHISPRSQTILAGETFTLECVGVQPFTQTTVYNFYHNQDVFFTEPVGMFKYPNHTGFPVFRFVPEQSTEMNQCTVSPWPVGSFTRIIPSQQAFLTIHSPADVTLLTASVQNGIATNSSHVSVQSGSDVTIRCHFSGVPVPSVVQWTWQGEPLSTGIVTEETVSTLRMRNVRERGVVQCHVENMYGRDSSSLYVCVEDQESLPGLVPFTVEPDTNTSIFLNWTTPTPLTTHPLLLRYEITIESPPSRDVITHTPLPGRYEFTASMFAPGELLRVSVVARSLLGAGPAAEAFVRTFNNSYEEVISGLSVCRTEDDSALVIQWDPIPSPDPVPVLPIYQVEYGMTGSENRLLASVVGESILVLEKLDNAASYEVRIRVLTQTQRSPALIVPGPWSDVMIVTGVTTLPTTQPTQQPATPITEGVISQMGFLLIVILVPVGAVILLVVFICLLAFCCWKRSQFRKNQYCPSKLERKSSKGSESSQRPMRSQVYSLPINSYANQMWTDNTCYSPVTNDPPSPQISSFGGASTPNLPTTRQKDIRTPVGSNAVTPALSVRSGTVTVTYLHEDSSSTPSPIPDHEPESVVRVRPNSEMTNSLNWNGASANSTEFRSRTSSTGTHEPQTWSPSSAIASTDSGQLTTPSPTRQDPFGYTYRESTSAASSMHKMALSVEGDVDPRRLSEQYDSLEPLSDPVKENLGGEEGESPYKMEYEDFKVLEELEAENVAMATSTPFTDL